MRSYLLGVLFASFALGLSVFPAAAQGQQDASAQSQDESIVDAARRARQQKKAVPPEKVWTNENLAPPPQEAPAADKPAAEGEATAAAPGDQTKNAKPADDAKKAAELEAQWRQRFADARKKLDDDQRELDLMQRELGVKSQMYYSDPNKNVREQYQRDSGSGGEVNDLVKKIDDQKQKIAADQQAIDDMEDALRKAGLPPGWSRTP